MMLNTLYDAVAVETDLEVLAEAISAGRALEGWHRQRSDAGLGEWVSMTASVMGAVVVLRYKLLAPR